MPHQIRFEKGGDERFAILKVDRQSTTTNYVQKSSRVARVELISGSLRVPNIIIIDI